jgi:hypothetical protein
LKDACQWFYHLLLIALFPQIIVQDKTAIEFLNHLFHTAYGDDLAILKFNLKEAVK